MQRLGTHAPALVLAGLAFLLTIIGAAVGNAADDAAKTPSRPLSGVLEVGDQKGGTKALLEASGLLKDLPYTIHWSIFAAAAPLFEALNAGAIDTGSAADASFLFAYAAGVPIKAVQVYQGPVDGHEGVGIVVAKDSPLRTVADLKGRKIGLSRGSAGHYFLIKALEKSGLTLADVNVVYLGPGDAKIALESGSIDAWSIWDPYLAFATIESKARLIIDGRGLAVMYLYQAAHQKAIVGKRAILDDFLRRLADARRWQITHLDAFTNIWAKETGLPLNVARVTLGHLHLDTVPIDDTVISAFNDTIAVYRNVGLISQKPIDPAAALDRSFNDSVNGLALQTGSSRSIETTTAQ